MVATHLGIDIVLLVSSGTKVPGALKVSLFAVSVPLFTALCRLHRRASSE